MFDVGCSMFDVSALPLSAFSLFPLSTLNPLAKRRWVNSPRFTLHASHFNAFPLPASTLNFELLVAPKLSSEGG